MANPYPADFQDGGGNVRISGKVNFTDPNNQPGNAGQPPVEVVRVPIVFDTTGLVVSPGIVLYTPAAGDILTAASCVSIETAWNGTDPYLRLFSQGEGVVSDGITSVDLTLANGSWSAKTANIQVFLGAGWTGFPAAALRFADATPLMAAVTQLGGATDPVSTQGAGEIVLEILKASA